MDRALVLNSKDNVANAIEEIKEGELIAINIGVEVKKVIIRKIKKGGGVIKYGERIGKAVEDIEKGSHVHVHNVESERGRGDLKAY